MFSSSIHLPSSFSSFFLKENGYRYSWKPFLNISPGPGPKGVYASSDFTWMYLWMIVVCDPMFYRNHVIQYIHTCLTLHFFLLNIMFLRFISVDMYTCSSFILKVGLYILYEYTTVVYSFSYWWTLHCSSGQMWVHLLEHTCPLSFQHILRSGIPEPLDMCTFNFIQFAKLFLKVVMLILIPTCNFWMFLFPLSLKHHLILPDSKISANLVICSDME